MSGNYVGNAGLFLIDTLFSLYILALMLRFLLQWARADFYNPFSQALVRVTNPPLIPLRRVIPGLWGMDLASLVLAWLLEMVKLLALRLIFGLGSQPVGLAVLGLAELAQLVVWILIIVILIRVVLSWINPQAYYSPMGGVLISLSEPMLAPLRRWLPDLGGLDLSPLFAFIVLELVRRLVIAPLLDLGRALI
ncbi:MAG: YggT family protein [Gammaproteobacteria bacterium]|nr:YggT family protein [Gammaproteobacteria bacterium]